MARQIEGINGGFCGRVGTVIGYEWRGKWCMRSYPRHIHDAKSPQQLRAFLYQSFLQRVGDSCHHAELLNVRRVLVAVLYLELTLPGRLNRA